MRARWLVWLSPLAAVVGLLACVGEGDLDGAAQGETGGACFPDQTCRSPLVCLDGICGDAKAGSGAVCGAAVPQSARDTMACGAQTCDLDADERCCGGGPGSACVPKAQPCPTSAHDWQCVNFDNCYTGAYCCLTPRDLQSTCPAQTDSYGTRCADRCSGAEIALCLDDSHCPPTMACVYLDVLGADPRGVGGCFPR